MSPNWAQQSAMLQNADCAGAAHDTQHGVQADMALALSLPAQRAGQLQLLELAPGHSPAAMWQAACRRGSSSGLEVPLLLLPEGFSMLPGDDNVKASTPCPIFSLIIHLHLTGSALSP